MTDNGLPKKPKLLFFQYKYGESLPAFLLTHKQEHVKCLSQFFDVQVIAEDCDYSEVCDKYEPDLALFESGVPLPSCRRLTIAGVRGVDRVPKLGFLHADGFCCGRAGFISDMEQWGIETFFAIASTAVEHTHQFQEKLFIWPNFIDEDVYQDYGQYKSIPVLFTGNKNSMYPWRQAILQRVARRYPSLVCPHSGYAPGASSAKMVVGESYARMLNAAWFVPSCGGVAKELVRKHLEIPGCNACLIAEKTPVLEAAGFVDMENCLFAEPNTVVDKIDALFRDEAKLSAIIAAGYKLVHSRHAMKHRNQVLQWYTLQKQLKPHQRIIQPGPFEPLALVDKASSIASGHLTANGNHLSLLRDGDKRMLAGDIEEAERAYLKCLTFISYMPEPQLKLAICNLLKGKPKQALAWINKPLYFTLVDYSAKDPDPVEWAYYLISLLCSGKGGKAIEEAVQFPWLKQRELGWTRWIVQACTGTDFSAASVNEKSSSRTSIHQLPERSLEQWVEHVHQMLFACGQKAMSEKLRRAYASFNAHFSEHKLSLPAVNPTLSSAEGPPLQRTLSSLKKNQASQARKQKAKQTLRRLLHGAESKFGYFLPFYMSSARNDELIETIQQVMRDEEPSGVVVMGDCASSVIGEAIVAVARESGTRPSLLLAGPSSRRITAEYDKVRFVRTAHRNAQVGIQEVLHALKNTDGAFDLFILDGKAIGPGGTLSEILCEAMQQARVVFLINLQKPEIHMAYRAMLENPKFVQVQQDPISWQGYTYFERRSDASHDPLSIMAHSSGATITDMVRS